MNKILILLPTRERLKNTQEAIESWLNTRTLGRSELVLGLDNDDPNLERYKNELKHYPVYFSIGDRIRMCPTVNRLVREYPQYKYYCFIGDDNRFRTKGWDQAMIDKLEKAGGGVAYGDDKLQGETLASAFVISKNLITLQGYLAYPKLVHMCVDNQVMILARTFEKLFYMPEIVIEHMHFTAGKSEKDALYASVNNTAVVTQDQKYLEEWRKNELPKIKANVPLNSTLINWGKT